MQFKSRRIFEAFVRNIRSELEHGWKRYKKNLEVVGNYKDIAEFLFEAHDNSWEYGHTALNGKNIHGIRFVQFRRYIGKKTTLMDLCKDFAELHEHVAASVPNKGTHQLIEVSVSDFGEGILDYFLNSKIGKLYRKLPRDEVLLDILTTSLTSKSADIGAGKGLEILIRAANGMGAFLTLRTAEFWLYRSGYARPEKKTTL